MQHRSGGRGNQPYRGRGGKSRGRGGFRFQNNNKPTCQICGKFGHSAAVCYFRGDMKYMGSSSSSSQIHQGQPRSFMQSPPQQNPQQHSFYLCLNQDRMCLIRSANMEHLHTLHRDPSQLNNCVPYGVCNCLLQVFLMLIGRPHRMTDVLFRGLQCILVLI
ncbi:hypothetical protein Syun_006013 [Stephania yunnanensis]|uniref:CCHC-type domain-containing protein n=1 Tax=Stephania yunnanensis TaxID=152371 RepID=A0AAP0KVU4_9MAGN